MRTRRIHLINPQTNSFTTRPLYLNRALYSPIAGLLAVAATIPTDKYEVVLTDENIEPIDFELKADLVGISAMTSYVKRGYEIADAFRARGIPVIMGGVHPSFMTDEALEHADAVVVGEAELVMPRVLDDLEQGQLRGAYKSDILHPMVDMPMPRYDLVKKHRYVNRTFIQTSRGCHHGCTFCSEPLMNGLRFRYRPVDEVIREVESCGQRYISLNDADFFGTPERPKEVMRALKGRGVRWQAGVTSKLALQDEMLELAAESGCYMLSIGFESISRKTLTSVHKHVNRPDTFQELVAKIHSYGILGIRPVHLRLRQRRTVGVRGDREVQHRCRLRHVRVLGADAVSGHIDVVSDGQGEQHRVVRLGQVRPDAHRLSAPGHDHRAAARRPQACL